MKKLSLLAIAAATMVSTPAFAQTGNVPLPPAPPPGTTFQSGTFGTFPGGTFQNGTFQGGVFPGFPTTIQRGFIVPPMWLGPQFQINNWQAYGFAQPPAGHRWVRYYNDAYLIDANGRVVDNRSGLDWDQYGDRWAMQNGIPHYEGRGEFRPDQRDYAWVQQYGGQAGYAPAGYGYSGNGQSCGGYASGYGCGTYGGYGVAYPIIIETTTYGGGCCTSCCASSCCEEVVEEVVEEVRYVPRRPVRRPVRRAPPPRPRPPAGERG